MRKGGGQKTGGGGAAVTGKHKKVNEQRGEKTVKKRCGS